MTVSLQYIQRIYGGKLRKLESVSRPQTDERDSVKSPEEDTVHISKASKRPIMTSATSGSIEGSILHTKLAISTYQNVAKQLPSILK